MSDKEKCHLFWFCVLWTAFLMCIAMACVARGAEADLGKMANDVMRPLVRVSSAGAAGSGTIVYSSDAGSAPGKYRTFVLTNYHVISGAIHVVRVWDSLTQSYRSEENNDPITVELFSYYRGGRTVISQPVRAVVFCHKEAEDLALLEIDVPYKAEYVAVLYPEDAELYLLQPVWAVGCSLGADPLAAFGYITDLEEIIDRRPYVMASANIIYGNSGGAVLTIKDGKWYLCGVPSRVTVSRGQAITHMGFFIGPERLRAFVRAQRVDFLIDSKKTPADAEKERERAAASDKREVL